MKFSNDPEYLKQKNDVVARLGNPEYDFDRTPLNQSAKELERLKAAYQSEAAKIRAQEKREMLDQVEAGLIVTNYQSKPAIPIDLTETDLSAFTEAEKPVVIDYFQNTNQTPGELSRRHKNFSASKIAALMRSGPFSVLAAKVYEYLGPLKCRNAVLKAIDSGDKQIIQRAAEYWGIFKNQALDVNVNKPIEDPELLKKLKEIGDQSS